MTTSTTGRLAAPRSLTFGLPAEPVKAPSPPTLPTLEARPTLPCPPAPSRAAARAAAELRVAGLRACPLAAEQHLATLATAEVL